MTAAPAAYVRRLRVPYRAPAFDVDVVLELDDAGLVVDCPGLAVRVR